MPCRCGLNTDVLDVTRASRFLLHSEKQKDTLADTFLKLFYDHFGVYIEDFRFQPEEQTVEADEPLSGKR